MKTLTKVLALTLALAMVLGMTACGGSSTASTPAATEAATIATEPAKVAEVTAETVSAKDTLIWGSKAAASGCFHPTLQYSNYDREVIFLVFDRLLTKDTTGNYVESLCEKYEINEDATTYTFYLKDGIKWHDGEPFTAEDVAFTYETTCHAEFGKGYDEFSSSLLGADAYHNGEADHVEGIKVIDDLTVSFTFKAPYLDGLVKFIDKPVFAKHIWEGTPVGQWGDATELLQNPVGTGPYKFVEFVPDQYVKLVANEEYFQGEPLIKNFIFKVSGNDTCQAEIVKGDIDVTEIRAWTEDGTKTLIENKIPMYELKDNSAKYIVFDTTDSRLSDVKVRQAFLYAMNRQAMIDGLLAGHGSQSNALMKPSALVYPKDLNTYDYNVETAKALLKEAGWEDTNNDGIVDKNGEKLTLTLQYSVGSDDKLAQVVQSFAKGAGIEVELVGQDFNTVLATLKDATAEFDLAFMGATYRANNGYGGSTTWMARWQNDPTEKELLATAAASPSLEAAAENYAAWCKYDNEMAPMYILYFSNLGYAANPKLVNFETAPDEWFYNVQNWYFEG